MEHAQRGAVPVVTIDGPSGSGKGTASRLLARELGWNLLDSGALYRLVGIAAQRRGVPFDAPARLAQLAAALDVHFDAAAEGEGVGVILDGEDVSLFMRSEEVGALASRVAAVAEVRQALLARQRAFRVAPGLVADGRDMGTVVFPDAELKVFLTASAAERAKRRYEQLKGKGEAVSLPRLMEEIEARDRRDSERAVAPLRPASDAVRIDSTGMDITQVLHRLMAEVRNRGISR